MSGFASNKRGPMGDLRVGESAAEKGVSWKRGLLQKGPFVAILETQDLRDSREFPECEKTRRI